MKRANTRLFALLLAAVMVISILPASARGLRDDEAVPAIPLGEEIAASTSSVETPVYDDDAAPAELLAAGDLTIPGYTQVTALRQIKADRKYLIVAQGPDGTFYALYLNAAGTSGHGPGSKPYLDCTATLSISGGTVSAVSTANTSTSIAMDNLHVTIAESSTAGKYTIKCGGYAVQINSQMYVAASSAPALELSFVGNQNRFSAKNTDAGRWITFNVKGATTTETHYPDLDTGFCGMKDDQTVYIPIYLFIQGSLPVEPGMNLSQMLSGDKIGGGETENANPDGQNSWVFTGGRAAQGSYTDVKGARGYAGHFEEYIRYTQAKQLQPSGESTTPYFQRHVINAAYTGQTLAQIVSSFETRITPLKPQAVSYLVDENGSSEASFAANLNSLITKALALQSNTGMIVIETLTAADKTAVDNVVNGLTDAQKVNVLSVRFTLTDAQKTDGYPNASGHFAMAQQLADAVVGSTVSTGANWPYSTSGSLGTMADGFPNKTSLDHAHGYTNPATLSTAQQAIKTKVNNTSKAMTWLFMGDSITHGAAWTGGYDTLAQLFEKFVKDDLHRAQDIVINAGSSGATTASTISDLNRRLVKYSPDVVVLMLGTNDAGSNVSETTYKTNIRAILDKIIAKGATPVLRTPPPTSRTNYDIATYAGYVRDVAEESKYAGKVVLVDQYGLWMNNDWSGVFSRDTLHPDEAGHLWFAHQLIKELALWNDSYQICRLEYKEMKEAEKIELPGYTLLTDLYNLDQTKGYLIVSQSADGDIYALYPSKDGETLNAGGLPNPGSDADGARAAKLTVSGDTVTAVWLKNNTPVDMKNLLFTIKKNTENNKYVFTAFTGFHLNMTTKMFTEGTAELAVTSRGTAALYAFRIQNGRRSLDFTKTGDPNAFGGSTYGTDFWCPNDNIKMNIYLFASTVKAPTAKESVQKLMDEIAAADLVENTYTRASWAALQRALNTADTLVKDTGVDDDAQEVKNAWDALRAAYEGLNDKPVPPTPGANKIEDWHTMVPAGGTTTNEPFKSGTGGSNKFRIPAIITLQHQTGTNASKNGRLLAAIDARWNHTGDACGLDTIVSYSDDTGANWRYQFANYFGDGTNAYAQYGTAFIDPVLLEGKDGTIYLMVDVWPGGIALNTAPNRPANSTGCEEIDGVKRLVLYTDALNNTASAVYDYYVGDFVGTGDKYAPVMEPNADGADFFSGYYIDEYYYLYYTNAPAFANKNPDNDKIYCQRLNATDTWVQQNVFFWNATLHVRNASYLWIIKSTDGGETWSKPDMINASRTDNEQFYGVGPGCGLCMEDGTLLLPVYIWPSELAGFIYSTDNGETWKPSPNYATTSSNATSESCLVQIDATTVRHFYRESWNRSSTPVAYTDHTWTGTTWTTGSMTTVSGANHYGASQVSAIKYSKQVDGKDLILYSTPTAASSRNKGVIYAFLVNDDAGHTLELYNTYAVNGDLAYAYSSLTETADGDIALLYESTNDAVIFKIIPITDIVPALTVTPYQDDYDGAAHTVAVKAEPAAVATLRYSTDGGTTWSNTLPTFTNVGTYTVTVEATWSGHAQWSGDKTFTATRSATVTIDQVTPTLTIASNKGTVMNEGDEPTFTISGVPGEGTITLTCSNTDPGHDPNIALTKQSDGTYTGTHAVETGNYTLTATYADPNHNYADATATYAIAVAPADFEFTVMPYSGAYDGQAHSIAVTAGDDITVTYCQTEDGTYTETLPEFTDAGTYTVYYQASRADVTIPGSANVTITKVTPTLAINCSHEHAGSHELSTADLENDPLILTITGVPAGNQGKFTLTTFNDAVRNLTRNEDGTWTAAPSIPPITRTYHFIATFDPTQNQDGDAIGKPNYNRATAEFTVTVSRPADEVIAFNFNFAEGVEIDREISTKGTFEVLYDGLAHGPLSALTYDEGLVLTYHVPTEDAEEGGESWTDKEPTFKQPGEYTVSVMASPADSPVAKVLTVVLNIVERETPTSITVTPSTEELEGGGTLTLTVEGAPEAGIITVTSTPHLTVTETGRGTYTVTLPNTTQSYTFNAEFEGAGSYQPSHASCSVSVTAKDTPTSKPSTSTTTTTKPTTEVKEDGTKVTTETKPDGTKVETVETPDGTTAVTETKKDGTVTEKVETPDGTKSETETKPDGTVTAKVEEPDGTKSVTETKPDGSKTATVEQADGTKSETVVTPEGEATVTVTDADGEELAKVEIPATIPEPETKFEDIDQTPWAEESINKVAGLELVKGVGGNKYDPVTPMTRGALATVLHRLSNGKTDYAVAFKDVAQGRYYTEGVAWAAKTNVVKGISADIFAPDDIITREQLAVMLARYAKLIGMNTKADAKSLEKFADSDSTGTWAVDGVAWCVEKGILKGKGVDGLDPTAHVSRAEVAVMLDRFIALIQK